MSTNHVFALLFYILKQEREREEGILSSGWEAHLSYCGAEGGLRLIFPNSPQIFSF